MYYIRAANINSYHKVVYKKDEQDKTKYTKVSVEYTSNPDIGISRAADPTAHVQQNNWGGVSDHRPVAFDVRANLRLKDMRRMIFKSLFFFPEAFTVSQKAYSEYVDELLEELVRIDANDKTGAQEFYCKLKSFITGTWEQTVRCRAPKRALWWDQGLGNVQQQLKRLARRWHGLDIIYRSSGGSKLVN